MHSYGLFVSKSHPFWEASPDNIFSCDCCGETAMEYKCPYSVRGMLISEVWDKVEYLEMHEAKLNPFVCERASTRASKYGQYLDKIFGQTRRIKYQTPLESELKGFSKFSAILVSFG